jgi:SAM-dependent methyltransferase
MTIAARLPNFVSPVFAEPIWGLRLQCPQCGDGLEQVVVVGTTQECSLRCPGCLFLVPNEDGIWKALPSAREAYFERFMKEYQAIRAAEGRGSESSEYYLALPYRDLSGRNECQWTIRARTFRYIEQKILPPIEAVHPDGMRALDLGAGNGWLSYRLALRGHQLAAIDLLVNAQDGLGAAANFRQHLPVLFPRFQAELDRLPFRNSQFDLAIFNASFHYSEDCERTLGEAIRCLRPGGTVIIADTAWYRHDQSGERMLVERRQAFVAQYGFASASIKSLEYLTDERLVSLEIRFGLRWKIHSPFYGFRWAMRPWTAKLHGRREPSQFRIYVAEVKK